MQVSKFSLHTSVSVFYAAANQFACVSLFKDSECRSEIHCTERRKCPPDPESRISCMFRQPKSCIKVFYSPTDTQVNCLKNNTKIYIKTAPTCSGAVTASSGSALFVLANIIVVKLIN